jgi:DNA-binding LacI/PurR family transcriptional regulator
MNLTEKIRQIIVEGVLSGKYAPGDRIPSERDLAEQSDTSRVTTRRAYDQLEKAGIIIRGSGKAGARINTSFRGNTGEIEMIAVIATLKDPFSAVFVEAVQKRCLEHDILAVLAVTDEDPAEQTAMAVRMAVRGVKNMIVWGFGRNMDFKIFERLRVLGSNIVFFDRVVPGPFADFAGLDNAAAAAAIFRDAYGKGVKKFVFAGAAGLDVDSNDERRAALQNLCAAASVRFDEFFVPWRDAGAGETAGICHDFFKERESAGTALMAVNDPVALRIKPHLPSGMKIYSVDGSPEALKAGIISYGQPVEKMAETAVELIQRQNSSGAAWKQRIVRVKGVLKTPNIEPGAAEPQPNE